MYDIRGKVRLSKKHMAKCMAFAAKCMASVEHNTPI